MLKKQEPDSHKQMTLSANIGNIKAVYMYKVYIIYKRYTYYVVHGLQYTYCEQHPSKISVS